MNVWGHDNATKTTRHTAGWLCLFLLAGAAHAQHDDPPLALPDLDELKIPLWHTEVQLRGAAGYKDNVTLSSTAREGSGFWMTGLEAIAFRLPAGGWQFNGLLDVTDVRYFSSASVDNEQTAVFVSELTRDLGRDWKSGLGLNYLFQNQVFDLSATYTEPVAIGEVVGHALTPHWRLRKDLAPFWVETELSATRQWLDAPLDDYWQYGPASRWAAASGLAPSSASATNGCGSITIHGRRWTPPARP